MKKKYMFLFFLIIHLPCMASQTAIQALKPMQDDLNDLVLMTAQDVSTNGSSNLNLTNHTGQALTVYGVYLYGVAAINRGLDCSNGVDGNNSATPPYMSGLVTPINFTVGQSIPVGQNYLYNMIYAWIYFYIKNGGNVNCLLPGCTWPGDLPLNWCFKLGAISPDAPYTFPDVNTNNIVPFAWQLTYPTLGYNYNLIPDNSAAYVWLGPFTCDDKTLTCTTLAPQYQAFPS